MITRPFAMAAAAMLATVFSGAPLAAQSVGSPEQGRAWAESVADIKAWSGEWHKWQGDTIYSPASAILSNGVLYIINRNGGENRKAIDNIRFARSYRRGQSLIHEYSVTCHPQFGQSSTGTLTVYVAFAGPYGDNRVSGSVRMDGCSLSLKRNETRVFSPPPYPPLQ
jgi:hypothetical protein